MSKSFFTITIFFIFHMFCLFVFIFDYQSYQIKITLLKNLALWAKQP